MKKHKLNDETILEDSGMFILHNSSSLYPHITKIYYQYDRSSLGKKMIFGDAIYLSDLKPEIRALAEIMGTAQDTILNHLPEQFNEFEIKNESNKI